MAKKVRKKGEEEEAAFEFPEFDEKAFLSHEFEQFYATVMAFGLGLVVGVATYYAGRAGLPLAGVLGVGALGVVLSAFVIRSLRAASKEYTRGDWASLIVLMFFAFLGVWLLLANLLGGGSA